MPLVDPTKPSSVIVASATAQNPVQVPQINTTDPGFGNITVDTRYTPIDSLMVHMAGMAWTVQYYSQVTSTDSQLSGQRPTSSGLYQQYIKIEDLVMRVTAPLSASQDPETKMMTYAGKAVVHGFIPNEGDMFVAEIGAGKLASFRILSSEKKSVFRQTAYEIDYETSSEDPTYLADLDAKVVDTRVWRDDLVPFGQGPVILKSLDALLDDAANTVRAILNQYFSRFFSTEYGTLMVPGQNTAIYDPYLVGFIKQMLNSDDCIEMQHMKVLNVRDDPVYKQNNLWLALANQDEMYLTGGFTRAGVTETSAFEVNPFFSGIRFTGVNAVVYPKDPTPGIQGVDPSLVKPISSVYSLAASTTGNPALFQDSNTGALPNNVGVSGMYTVTFDDYYVLSQNFYNQNSAQSQLEAMVRQHLQRHAIDLTSLMATARSFNQWGLVEQFYYLPIVLCLIRGGTFSS